MSYTSKVTFAETSFNKEMFKSENASALTDSQDHNHSSGSKYPAKMQHKIKGLLRSGDSITHSTVDEFPIKRERSQSYQPATSYSSPLHSESYSLDVGKVNAMLLKNIINRTSSEPSANKQPMQYFTQGTVIEVYNKMLKRVEDISTNDLLVCAEDSQLLPIFSTVTEINHRPNTNLIEVSLLVQPSQRVVQIASPMEHPFMVENQGWSSYDPDSTFQTFNLRCRQLAVGDIVITVTKRNAHTQLVYRSTHSSKPLSSNESAFKPILSSPSRKHKLTNHND